MTSFCRQPFNDLEEIRAPQCIVNGSLENCEISKCEKSCPAGYFACSTGECLPDNMHCDLIPDCPLRDDEIGCPARTALKILDSIENSDALEFHKILELPEKIRLIHFMLFQYDENNEIHDFTVVEFNDDLILKSHDFTNSTYPGILILLKETKFVRVTVDNSDNSKKFLGSIDLKYGQTDCIKDISEEYFTNRGTESDENYENGELCLYYVSNPGLSQITLDFKIEKMKNFRSADYSCVDSLFILDQNYRHVTGELCGAEENFEILADGDLIFLLATDLKGKYELLKENRALFEVDPRRPILPCCASDCDSSKLN